jgi:hypothetical protein
MMYGCLLESLESFAGRRRSDELIVCGRYDGNADMDFTCSDGMRKDDDGIDDRGKFGTADTGMSPTGLSITVLTSRF